MQPRDDRSLDHLVGRCALAARDDARATGQRRPERRAEAHRHLRRQVDVDEAEHAVLAKEARRRPRLPDQALVDLRAVLDLLVRVDPDARVDDGLVAERHLVADRHALVDARVRAHVAVATEDRALDDRAAADVAGRVDDRSRQAPTLAQRAARPEHRVRADRRLGRDGAIVPDERGALDVLDVVDLDARPDPDIAPDLHAADVQSHLLVERVEVRLAVLVEVPDVLPVAVADVAVDRAPHLEEQREELLREVVWPVRRDVAEHLGLEHVDAGVDRVGEDLAPRRLLEEALDAPVLVGDDDPELERVLDRLQADRHRRALFLVELDDLPEVDVAERVARDHEERLLEHVAREAHRAGGAERAFLDGVGDIEPERLAVAEVRADRLRQEGDRDDDLLEAVLAQQLEDVLHAGLPDNRHHRLRLVGRERPKACALTARHDDSLHQRSSLRALAAYNIRDATASPKPIQKIQSGQAVDGRVTIEQPTPR